MSEICSLTLKCEIRVSLFEMFRVIENRSNVSVAMTSRVLNSPRGTSASFRSSLHSGSRTTRAYTTRRSSALESSGSNSVSRQAAVLHRNWSVPLIHFGCHYAAQRASLYLLPICAILCTLKFRQSAAYQYTISTHIPYSHIS